MGAKAFVDTNILLRFILKQMDSHAPVTAFVKQVLKDEFELWISGQIIREFIVQATNPKTLGIPLTIEQVLQDIQTIKKICHVADETELVRATLLELIETHPTSGKQVHDANIVATMLVYEIDTLLTLNLDDLKRFSDKITILSPTKDQP